MVSAITGKAAGAQSRFDYVAYDEKATKDQAWFKEIVTRVEAGIGGLDSPRAKALALTKLEEVYMWIGKAIRDDQITRKGSAPLQESRNNE